MDLYGEKQHYTVNYKDSITGEMRAVLVEAHGKLEAEEAFRRHVNRYCEIINIQTNKEVAEEIADIIFKGIKKDLGKLVEKDKKFVIDPSKVRTINYNSRSFLRGLKKVNKQRERTRNASIPDHEKMYQSFNI
jgi:hypothetical protein